MTMFTLGAAGVRRSTSGANVPLYVMGALFLVGTACWMLIDPTQPVFAEAAEPVPGQTSPALSASSV